MCCPGTVMPDSLRLADCVKSNALLLSFYCFEVIYPSRTINSTLYMTVEEGYQLSNLSIRMFSKLPVPLVCKLLPLGPVDETFTPEVGD